MAGKAPTDSQWMQVRTKSVSAEIVSQIRNRVFSGDLLPGDFVGSERNLSVEFGVSRVTMRDALRILEATGIVEVKVGKGGGVRICQPNLDRIVDSFATQLKLSGISLRAVFEAQIGVEVHAAKLAAAHATPEEIRAIEDQLRALADAASDPTEFVERSQDLHVAVTRGSHNEALTSMYQALSHLARPFMVAGTDEKRVQKVMAHHRKVLAAIKKGDPDRAGAVVMSHLKSLIEAHVANPGGVQPGAPRETPATPRQPMKKAPADVGP